MKVKLQQQAIIKRTTINTNSQIYKSRNKTVSSRNNQHSSNGIKIEGITNYDSTIPKLPNLTSTNWCLYDSIEDRFVGFRENTQRQVGSITKIMTCIIALNLIQRYSLDNQILIRISKTSSQMIGTSAQLRYGKWVRIQDLLYGAMIPSGNDAAYLIAEVFGLLLYYQPMKSEDKDYQDIESIDISLYDNTLPFINKFIKEMNRKAKQLKLLRTSFANPHGLANSLNFSTANDVLLLARYACSNPKFKKIMNTQQYQCQFLQDDFLTISETKKWINTNKLLSRGWQGVKTGQTIPAGACLVSVKQEIYIIILNSQTADARFEQTQILYKWYQSLDHEQ